MNLKLLIICFSVELQWVFKEKNLHVEREAGCCIASDLR